MNVRIPQDHPSTLSKIGPAPEAPADAAEAGDGLDAINRGLAEGEARMADLLAKSDPGPWAGAAGGAPFSADALLGDLAKEHARLLEATQDGATRRTLDLAFQRMTERARPRAVAREQAARLGARAGGTEDALLGFPRLAARRPEEAAQYLAAGLGMLQRLRDSGTQAAAVEARAGMFRQALLADTLEGLANTDGDGALRRFDGDEFHALFSDSEHKTQARGLLADKIERARTHLDQDPGPAVEAARLSLLEDLEAAIADGTASHGAIADAINQGGLDAEAGADLAERLRGADQARIIRRDMITRAEASLGDGLSPPEQKDAEAYYTDAILPHLTELPPAPRGAALDYAIAALGRVPGPLLAKLHGNLLAGDARQVTLSATHLARWSRQSPDLANQIAAGLGPEMDARTKAMAEYAELDIPPERALQLAADDSTGPTN